MWSISRTLRLVRRDFSSLKTPGLSQFGSVANLCPNYWNIELWCLGGRVHSDGVVTATFTDKVLGSGDDAVSPRIVVIETSV